MADTKCIKCQKLVTGNSVCCDECNGWVHLKCAGMTLKSFKPLVDDPNLKFSCKYCTDYKCGKCNKPVYEKNNSIKCDVDSCSTWYHLKCTRFTLAEYKNKKSRLHCENWYCPQCTCTPFDELSQSDFMNLQNDDKKLKEYFNFITSNSNFGNICSVCSRKVSNSHLSKSFPCTSCNKYVHRKCTGIPLSEIRRITPSQLKNWNCRECISYQFPLSCLEDHEVAQLSFNSNLTCNCNNHTESVPLNLCETFTLADSYLPKDSPFNFEPDVNIDTTYDINSKCDYNSFHDFHKLTQKHKNKNKKPFTALHTNIESLMHNFDSLEHLCTDLDYPFDVIGVTETWNAEKNKDKFIAKKLPGYDDYKGLTGTTLKSGCGFYIRTGLTYIERKDLDIQFHDDLNEFQMKFIEIINAKSANIILNITYRHPRKTSDKTYNDKLQDILSTIAKEHKINLFMGDFNYNLFNHDKEPHIKTFIETMYQYGLQPTINKPTRVVKGQKPSLLDNFFTNAIDKDIQTGNITDKITDHMPNFFIMKNLVFEHKKVNKKVRTFKNFDTVEYQKDVDSIDLTPVLHFHVNEIYKYFHDQLINVIDKHAPHITLTNKQLKWKEKPWIDARLQRLVSVKNILYRKFLSKRRDIFWFNRYKTIKKRLEYLLFQAKKDFFKQYFATNLNNARKIWKGINEIIHNRSNKTSADIYLDDKGQIVTDQKIVANRFNSFYTNVAKNLLKDLGKTPTKYQDYLRNPNEHSIFFNETDPGEISEIICKLDTTKSGDIYGITPKLVNWAPCMAKNLSIIFNKSINDGVFPHLLKVAKVIPIHKGDSKMVPSNYRPISLLPIFGKIFEKLIFKRLTDFINKYKILYKKQYGFQRGKATEHAVMDIEHDILKSMENKEHPCCVFLDFAKAFDTVDHQILLQKLYHYGIRGKTHQLIESYLTDREQCVQVNNSTSDLQKITHGVPQGSILGPLLFLLYINDIANSSALLSFYLFADDTAIFFSAKCVKELEKTINQELVNVSHWLIANKLSLNLKKSNALLFRKKNDSNELNLNLVLNGVPIEEKQKAKYLGIIMDNKLTFEDHIKHIKSKLIKGNAILAKVRHFIPAYLLINTYNAHIQPHIDYGHNLWGYAAQCHLDNIVTQQKRSLRIMHFKDWRFRGSSTLFLQSKILPISKQILLNSGKTLWKAAHGLICPTLQSLFKKKSPISFHLPFKRLDVSQNSIFYSGVRSWNSIPAKIRASPSVNSFKKEYKDYLLKSIAN